MMTNKDIGFLKRQLLKIITVFQEVALVNDRQSLYFWLVNKHFEIYFGATVYGYLVHASNVVDGLLFSPEIESMLDRHANMVLENIFLSTKSKKIHDRARIVFLQHILDTTKTISHVSCSQPKVLIDVFK